METLDLVDHLPLERADHWHRVRAPGGYEWWEFDARDEGQKIRVVLSFHDGFAFDPEYARRYAAYRRRPTAQSPPVPREYPCVQFAIFENDVLLTSDTIRFAEGAFQADVKSNVLSIGVNRIELGSEETRVRFQGGDPAVSAEMVFRQASPSLVVEQTILSFENLAEHRWVVAQPRCDVDGRINFNGREIQFRGIGYRDHYYGGGPIGPKVRQSLRGCAILPNRTVAFHVSTDDASGKNEFVAITVDDAGVRRIDEVHCSCAWNGRTLRGLAIAEAVNFGESLVLRRSRVVDSSPTSLRVLYDAFIDGETCTAWGEIVYPARLHKGLAHCGVMKWLEG
jgi:hypothetical protein